MLDVAEDVNPDYIYILGDFADFYDINSHGKAPDIQGKLIDELSSVHYRLEQLQLLFPDAAKTYIAGNHEHRLARYISNKAPELFGIVDVKELLYLDTYGYKYVAYGPEQKAQVGNSHLYARHEGFTAGLHIAHGTVVKGMASIIFGHCHRIQESQVVAINGDNYRGIASGWLGDKNHPVFNYVKNHHQWALGFSIVTILEDGTFFNSLIHIIDYKCVVDGTLYIG